MPFSLSLVLERQPEIQSNAMNNSTNDELTTSIAISNKTILKVEPTIREIYEKKYDSLMTHKLYYLIGYITIASVEGDFFF